MNPQHFNPYIGTPKITADNKNRDHNLWFIEWQRMPIPRTETAERYRVSSYQLLKYALAGPLDTNARQFKIGRNSQPPTTRQYPNATIGGAGLINGQIISQPLYDTQAGGYTAQIEPRSKPPFWGLFGDTIAPAGVA